MKLSVFTVSVPDMTPTEFAKAASLVGIEGIEWRFKGIPEDALLEDPSFWRNNRCSIDPSKWEAELPIFTEAALSCGMQSIALVPYLTCGDMKSAEQAMLVASRLGASMVRVGVPTYDRKTSYNDLYDLATRYLAQIQELAEQYKVKALVETHHKTIAPSASLAYRLVQSLNPDRVGVLYDPGNMVFEGFENYRLGLQLLGPYLGHVHFKNAIWCRNHQSDTATWKEQTWKAQWASIDKGIVPWIEVMRDLKAVGYDGYVGIEDFSQTYDSMDMLKNSADLFRLIQSEI
ncbi:sugar phosphate isomerase/epimerase [Paenibacillus sp. DS2015]|uniref:sugar phosphate isomerase/epimerase family protein n=1 Tax=Paenibacillus sp. DS2015 TaxID=3373917 RepID=UPI003D1CBA80